MDASSTLLCLLLLVLVAGLHVFVSGQETSKDQRNLSLVDDLEEELLELKLTGEEAIRNNKSALQTEDIYSVINGKNIWSGNSSRLGSPEDNKPIVNITEEIKRIIPPQSFDTIQKKQSVSKNAFGKMKEITQEADKENVIDVQEENDTVAREFHKVAEDLLEMLIHIAERPDQWDKLLRKLTTASQNGDETESLKSNKRQKFNEMIGKKVLKLENMADTNNYRPKEAINGKQNYTLYNWKDRNSRIKQLLKNGILQPRDQLAKFAEYHNINANEVTNFGEREPPILHSNMKLEHEKESQVDRKLTYPENEILQLSESELKKHPPKSKQISQYMIAHNLNLQSKFNETKNMENSAMGISKSRTQSSGTDSSTRISEGQQPMSGGGCNGKGSQESRNSLPEGHRWPHFTYHRVTSRPAQRASHRDAYIAVSVARGTQHSGSSVDVGVGVSVGSTTPATSPTPAPPYVETIGRVLRMRDPLEEELVEMAAARSPPAPQRTPIPLPVSFVAWSHAQHLNKLQEQIKSLAAMEDKLNYKSADRERLRQILRDGKSDPVGPIRAM